MSMRHAIVRRADGAVVNVAELADGAKWTPPDGHDAIRDGAGEAQPGGRWDGVRFHAPMATVDEGALLAGATGDRRLLAALVLRAWPDATAAERTWAADVIAAAGLRIREARA